MVWHLRSEIFALHGRLNMAANSLTLLPMRGRIYIPSLNLKGLDDFMGKINIVEVISCPFLGTGLK